MITAHLPSGYVLGTSAKLTGVAFGAAMVGAVFPDLDLFVFYFIDDRAIHHHRYWVHIPLFAMACSATLMLITRVFARAWMLPAVAFSAAWLMHIFLDSIAGGILWGWPFSNTLTSFINVPGREGVPWIIAFLTHWSIIFEVMIWAAAVTLWLRRRRA